MYEGVYTKRYDFWHESREIIRSLIFSFVMVMAYLALDKKYRELLPIHYHIQFHIYDVSLSY